MALLDRVRAVILDLDGTLIDSMRIWYQIDIDFFAENGLEMPEGMSETVARMSIDQWADYFVENFVPHLTPAQVIARVEEMASVYYRDRIPMKPYVPELLGALAARGLPCGICTATYRSSASAVLHRLGLDTQMQFVLTGEDFPDGKSTPAMFLAAAERFSLPAGEILVVEDSLHCVEMAVSCGFPTAVVYDDCIPPEDWERAKALAAVHGNDLAELLAQLTA